MSFVIISLILNIGVLAQTSAPPSQAGANLTNNVLQQSASATSDIGAAMTQSQQASAQAAAKAEEIRAQSEALRKEAEVGGCSCDTETGSCKALMYREQVYAASSGHVKNLCRECISDVDSTFSESYKIPDINSALEGRKKICQKYTNSFAAERGSAADSLKKSTDLLKKAETDVFSKKTELLAVETKLENARILPDDSTNKTSLVTEAMTGVQNAKAELKAADGQAEKAEQDRKASEAAFRAADSAFNSANQKVSACLSSIDNFKVFSGRAGVDLNNKCAEASGKKKKADNTTAGSSGLLNVAAGIGKAAISLTGAYLTYKQEKEREEWEKEQLKQKNNEKCEIRCQQFAFGTPEHRRCSCAGGCGFQYNCNDTPCSEQFAEVGDKTEQQSFINICLCQKKGMKYVEESKKCMQEGQEPVAPSAINDTPSFREEDKTADPAKPTTPTTAAGGGAGGKSFGGSLGSASLGKDSGSSTKPSAITASKNNVGGFSDYGRTGFNNGSMGGFGAMQGNMGSNMNAFGRKEEKPKDIAVSAGMSVFDLVTQVYQMGIQANRFVLADIINKNVQKPNASKTVIKRNRRGR